MTDKKRVSALLPSKNKEDIGPPFGVVHASFFLGKEEGKELESAAFSIRKGIIECPVTCHIYMRFDDEEPIRFKASHPSAGMPNIVFFEDPLNFFNKLKNAKRVRVQPSIYGAGATLFDFEQTEPLNW